MNNRNYMGKRYGSNLPKMNCLTVILHRYYHSDLLFSSTKTIKCRMCYLTFAKRLRNSIKDIRYMRKSKLLPGHKK